MEIEMLGIKKLKEITKTTKLINLTVLVGETDLSYSAIDMRLLRDSELKVDEANKLEEALNKFGLYLGPVKGNSGRENVSGDV